LDHLDSSINHVVNNGLGRQLVVHNGGNLAHEERAGVVEGIVINVVAKRFHVVLDGDLAFAGEFADLLRSVRLPIRDVRVVADAKWATSEDDGSDVVIEASGADGFLVSFGGTGLLGEDESSPNPDGAGAELERSSERLAIVETTSSDDLHGLAGQWALVVLDEGSNSGDQDGGWHITSVATALSSLSADKINTEFEALLDVLGVSDHVHVENSSLVELLDNVLGRDTDGGNEETGARLDDNVNEGVELALGVVVVGLARISTDLRKQKINTERSVLVLQEALELSNLLLEHVWRVADTSNDTETSGICDSSGELRASGNVHASKEDGVVDLQEIGRDRSDLLR